jgi:hypothetical protein
LHGELLVLGRVLDDGNETMIDERAGNEFGKLQRRGFLEKGRLQKGKCLLPCV